MKALHSEKRQHRATPLPLCPVQSLREEERKLRVKVLVGSMILVEAGEAALAQSQALSAWTLCFHVTVRPSFLQGDVCFPRCESNIMGSPVLPIMSCSGQYSCSLQSELFTASPAELYTATTKREKAVSPGQLLITKNYGSVSLPSSHVGKAMESSDSHRLSLLLLDYHCNNGSR